jgi:hypothetical protein
MNPIFAIWTCAAAITALYLLGYFCVFRYAQRTICCHRNTHLQNDTIEIYANARALEYDIRLSLVLADVKRLRIIVNIPKNDAASAEMLDTVRMMRRRHKNIFYRMI